MSNHHKETDEEILGRWEEMLDRGENPWFGKNGYRLDGHLQEKLEETAKMKGVDIHQSLAEAIKMDHYITSLILKGEEVGVLAPEDRKGVLRYTYLVRDRLKASGS